MSDFKILGRHPTLWIALLNVVVMGIATLGFRWLDNDQAGLIVAGINAVFAAINAWVVRPIPPAVFTYAAASLIAIGASYGLNITPEQSAGLNSVLISVLAFLTYGNVSPVETRLTKASDAMAKPEVQTVPEAN